MGKSFFGTIKAQDLCTDLLKSKLPGQKAKLNFGMKA